MDPADRPEPLRPSQGGQAQVMSRAQKFDDEKRRITDSCFGKLDENGRPLQNYITHIRVEEDGMYPTGPPPPDASLQYKKSRAIIVAVKNSGRVWLHKARENADGTFQIGKSWPMEDLSGVEVFNVPPAQDVEKQQRAQRAGSTGFVVTMSKPYYWAASTAKEKDFFVASLVKIYRKYTAGKMPELVGFPQSELNNILGSSQDTASQSLPTPQPHFASPQPRSQSPTSRPVAQQTPVPRPPKTPEPLPPFSQAGSPSQKPPSPLRPRNVTPMSDYGRPSTSQSSTYGRDPSAQRAQPSQEGLPSQLRTQTSQDGAFRRTPGQDALQPPTRLRSPPVSQNPHPAISNMAMVDTGRLGPPPLLESADNSERHSTREVFATPPESVASHSMSSVHGSASEADSQGPLPQAVPERRRPPLQDGYGRGRAETLNEANGHLSTRSSNQELRPSPLSTSQSVAREETPRQEPVPAPLQSKTSDASSKESQSAAPELEPAKQHRPGLGPMTGRIKQQENAASKMRKAATAAGAFKPRAGGAGARLLANKNKKPEDEAPINQVVPAPSASRTVTTDDMTQAPVEMVTDVAPPFPETMSPAAEERQQPSSPQTRAMSSSNGVARAEPEHMAESDAPAVQTLNAEPEETQVDVTRKQRSNKYDAAFGLLDIDTAIFAAHQREYAGVLTDFGWETSILSGKRVDALETDLRREIARLEAGSWLGTSDQKDDRVEMVQKMLDKAIAECDEMEGLLTLYGVELGTLNADIAYIEAQSHGLQVQTANQKALQTKLQDLVETVSIDPAHLEPLRRSSISEINGLESLEICLVQLYEALATIDPSMIQGKSLSAQENDSLNTMRSLQDRKGVYLNEIFSFLDRLRQYMDPTFATAFTKTLDSVARNSAGGKGSINLDVSSHDLARAGLWQYSPLMLFAKEIDMVAWDGIVKIYIGRAGNIYRNEFRDNISAWKKTARKASGVEQQQALFTSQEMEKSDGMIRSAQKLTVKRSQMLARGLRTGSFEKKSKVNKDPDAKFDPFETLAGVLDEMLPVMTCEQNFVVDFFHASSSETMDFAESVASSPPSERRGTNLFARKPVEPNRDMANRVLHAMEHIYGFWPADMQSLIDWAVSGNELQAVGILCAMERSLLILSDTSQEFITRTLQKLLERLAQLFLRTVDAQIRAIEDTKVKIKKRKGVIHFMKVFPNFAAVVESMLPPADSPEGRLEIRAMVDKAYTRINKAMFDSLKVIAKESPVAAQATTNDPDDKEALNYHILLIENMHHYREEVLEHGDAVLGEWRAKAGMELAEHQQQYVAAIIRRPLGKLLDFVESVESILASSAIARANPSSLPTTHPSQSRAVFKKVASAHGVKDLRKGVEALRLRVEKHLGDADEPALSQRLVAQVLEACEREYVGLMERARVIGRDVYEGSVELEVGRAEVAAAFHR